VLVNTSLNLNGQAIANSVDDALSTLFASGIDRLFLGELMIDKPDRQAFSAAHALFHRGPEARHLR